jgi:hypothetical protein
MPKAVEYKVKKKKSSKKKAPVVDTSIDIVSDPQNDPVREDR